MVFSHGYLVGLSIRSPFLHTCIVHKACPLRETAIGPRITYLPGRPSCNDGASLLLDLIIVVGFLIYAIAAGLRQKRLASRGPGVFGLAVVAFVWSRMFPGLVHYPAAWL